MNIGSLALLFAVRQQIRQRLHALRDHIWTRGNGTGASENLDLPIEPAHVRLSRSGVRELARLSGPQGDNARYLASLQRVQFDLIVIASTVAQLSIGGGILTLSLAILLSR